MRKQLALFASLTSLCLTGCPPQGTSTLPPATNGGGWIVSTGYIDNLVIASAPETTVTGVWVQDLSGPAGDASPFTVTTDDQGLYGLLNARVPAEWQITWVSSNNAPPGCNGKNETVTPGHRGALVEVNCIHIGTSNEAQALVDPFAINPSPLNPASMPETVTITGSGFNAAYGMPVVQYFDMNGDLVAQQAASSISDDGTTISLVSPPVSEMNAGVYAGILNNVNADGSYTYVGTTAVEVSLPLYRPTTYSFMSDQWGYPPQGWEAPNNPSGPTAGTSTVEMNSAVQYTYEASGQYYVSEWSSNSTWSSFPEHIDTSDLTLYVPYSANITNGGYEEGFPYLNVSATMGSAQTTLYSGVAPSSAGEFQMTIPAGTDLSTVQVTLDYEAPEDDDTWDPTAYAQSSVEDFDIYVQ